MAELLMEPGRQEEFVEDAKHQLLILNHTGHAHHIWDPSRPAEVEAARAMFDSLRAKGYVAYTVKEDHTPGDSMREFNPQAGKVILRPGVAGG